MFAYFMTIRNIYGHLVPTFYGYWIMWRSFGTFFSPVLVNCSQKNLATLGEVWRVCKEEILSEKYRLTQNRRRAQNAKAILIRERKMAKNQETTFFLFFFSLAERAGIFNES
jgi:hypothetical protein